MSAGDGSPCVVPVGTVPPEIGETRAPGVARRQAQGRPHHPAHQRPPMAASAVEPSLVEALADEVAARVQSLPRASWIQGYRTLILGLGGLAVIAWLGWLASPVDAAELAPLCLAVPATICAVALRRFAAGPS